MQSQALTLNVPDLLYRQLEKRACAASRSIEAEILEVVATAIPLSDELPTDLAAALSPLMSMNDEGLWQAAKRRLDPDAAAQLEKLHRKQARASLTESERKTLAGLVGQYESAMLVRAQATALLKQRGHHVSVLASPV